jgi:hypothetical protein
MAFYTNSIANQRQRTRRFGMETVLVFDDCQNSHAVNDIPMKAYVFSEFVYVKNIYRSLLVV